MGKTLWPAGSDSPAASGRAKPAAMRVRACALVLGSSLLCLHISWMMNGRMMVRPGDFPTTLVSTLPDSVLRMAGAPLLGMLNLLVIVAVHGILICLLGRWLVGALLAIAAMVALAAANQMKQRLLQEPIVWQDLTLVRGMAGLLGEFVQWSHLAMAGVAMVAVMLVYRLDAPLRLPRLRPRLRMLGLVLSVLVPAGLLLLPPVTAERCIGLPEINHPQQDYQQALTSYSRTQGLVLSVLMTRRRGEIVQPPEYGPDRMSEVALQLVHEALPQAPVRRPHVIAVMYESLWDVTQLPGVRISPDPLSTFRAPPGNGQAFQMLSPVFGRPTANVEFEFLTGMSMSFLPNGAIPYLDMMHEEVPSLPMLLRQNGYRAVALHPYESSFWNRSEVYPKMGFERFEDIGQFGDAEVRGHYVSDDAVADRIIRCIEGADEPTFLFAVTMQNHAPHEREQYRRYDVRIRSRLSDDEQGAVLAYAQGVYDADRSLRKLIRHFSESERPVVLLAFGDHLVPLASVYHSTGYLEPGNEESPSQRLKMRATPAILWTNMDAPLPETAPVLSASLLSPSLLHMAGVSDPYFTGLLGKVQAAAPGLSRYVSVDAAGRASQSPPDGSRQVLREYALIQHDLLLGQRYALPWLKHPQERPAGAVVRGSSPDPRLQ